MAMQLNVEVIAGNFHVVDIMSTHTHITKCAMYNYSFIIPSTISMCMEKHLKFFPELFIMRLKRAE